MTQACSTVLRWLSFLACFSLLASCCGSDEEAATPSRGDASSSTAVTPPSAAARPGSGAAAAEPIELLHAVEAQVVVSSTSSPGMSGPSRMVDRRMDTAWNSATGDLVGAWFAVALPEQVEVSQIKLVPGYVRSYHGRDLFEKNHRIKRIRVTRDGHDLGEHQLDITRPELQTVPVGGPGGLYKVEVTEVVPGSNRRWREVCVTELEVWGRPGGAAVAPPAEQPSAVDAGPRPVDAGPPPALLPESLLARSGTLRGDTKGPPRLSIKGLTKRQERSWTSVLNGYGLPEDAAEAERHRWLVQGSWVTKVLPVQMVELSAPNRDRVAFTLYSVHPSQEVRMQKRMERRRPGKRSEDCVDAEPCGNLRLARVSIPADGMAVLDADVELAEDVCELESQLVQRDLDNDQRDEMLLKLNWQTHPVCPIGADGMTKDLIVDLETGQVQFSRLLRAGTSAPMMCFDLLKGTRMVRDFNQDGHPDYRVSLLREVVDCSQLDADLDPPIERTFSEERYLYRPELDRWVLEPRADGGGAADGGG